MVVKGESFMYGVSPNCHLPVKNNVISTCSVMKFNSCFITCRKRFLMRIYTRNKFNYNPPRFVLTHCCNLRKFLRQAALRTKGFSSGTYCCCCCKCDHWIVRTFFSVFMFSAQQLMGEQTRVESLKWFFDSSKGKMPIFNWIC